MIYSFKFEPVFFNHEESSFEFNLIIIMTFKIGICIVVIYWILRNGPRFC